MALNQSNMPGIRRLGWCVSLGVAGLLAASCEQRSPKADPSRQPHQGATSATAAARVVELRAAEAERRVAAVRESDTRDRDPRVRRAAARLLSRVANAEAVRSLTPMLRDEDPRVVAWAAFGVGRGCQYVEGDPARLLVMRAASLATNEATKGPHPEPGAGRDFPDWRQAMALALGQCATTSSEQVLTSWLARDESWSAPAARALGRVAAKRGRLSDDTLVALLNAATRARQRQVLGLYPFTQLAPLAGPIAERLVEVAGSRALATDGDRQVAIRALGRGGERALGALAKVLQDAGVTGQGRALAVVELASLGAPAQGALVRLAPALAKPMLDASWQLDQWPALDALLDVQRAVAQGLEPTWVALAELPIVKGPPARRRRIIAARCRAADLLAGSATLSRRLVACDPEPTGREGRLARLRVIDRGALAGSRLELWEELLRSDDPVVRQAALRQLPRHPEAPAARWLAEALEDANAGTVATAAEVLAAYPGRAGTSDAAGGDPRGPRPDPAVVEAIAAALKRDRPPDAVQTRIALARAAGALQILGAKASLEVWCRSAVEPVRREAAEALLTMGAEAKRCAKEKAEGAVDGVSRGSLGPSTQRRLVFDTDVGPLSLVLDPDLAPLAARRIRLLVAEGFYDGTRVHRAVPGFLVQFGDRDGDGYGGAGLAPVPAERSPLPFRAGAVGLALAGGELGSSQLFVVLADSPQLDGDYPLVGWADPGWERLAVGDEIRQVRLEADASPASKALENPAKAQ